jgi:hypothetical protein
MRYCLYRTRTGTITRNMRLCRHSQVSSLRWLLLSTLNPTLGRLARQYSLAYRNVEFGVSDWKSRTRGLISSAVSALVPFPTALDRRCCPVRESSDYPRSFGKRFSRGRIAFAYNYQLFDFLVAGTELEIDPVSLTNHGRSNKIGDRCGKNVTVHPFRSKLVEIFWKYFSYA